MTDNVTLDGPGTGGDTIATDDVGGAQYQRIKITDGVADSTVALDIVAEDEAHVTGDTGIVNMVVRNDTLAALAGTDGDYTPLQVNASGALYVDGSDSTQPVSGTVTANLSATDNAVLDNIQTAVQLIDNAISGTEMQVDLVSANVTNAGTFATQATLQAGTAAFGKLSANSGVDIGDVDVTSITGVTMSNAGMQITGDEAHDAADAGNPVKVGGKAKAFDGTAAGTDSAEDDRVDFIATVEGRQYVETTHPNYWHVSADYAVAATNTTVKAAPGVGLKLYITDVIVSNGATAGNVTLLDGSGGTVLLELYPAINGGLTHSFRSPLVLTANTLLAITSTTVTTHSVTVSGFIAA